MSFLEILYTVLIGPLQLVFEIIFAVANRMTGHPGMAIIVLSLIMNVLVLSLYRRADQMQEEARDIDLKLRDGVSHIKKSFSGDERMMILQTYYRQNHYKPTDALNGSVSLLLEIPFFIAAYQFLSHLEILQGVSLGPIANLAAPDGLLVLGGVTVNLLPVAMTTVNVISSALYLKGFPIKTKIQLYAMALFFLVFLYTSPSGLVFYWTLNNVFSLGKNIFYKIKNPAKIIRIALSLGGIGILGYGLLNFQNITLKAKAVLLIAVIMLQMPLVFNILKEKKLLERFTGVHKKNDKRIFILGNIFLTVFIGILLPSAVLSASPLEFMSVNCFYNPLWYLVESGCLAMGTFLIWMGVFYWLASDGAKVIFDKVIWALCGIVIVNYMFFGTKLGILFPNLQYENGMEWGFRSEVSNLIVMFFVVGVMCFVLNKARRLVPTILLTVVIAVMCMTGSNIITINKSVNELKTQTVEIDEGRPYFNLSKNGKNVIVLMLDRAMNQYVPYMFNEKPELKEQFAGFTYYSNTISHGGSTNFTTPALFGGYEYTPVENNKRNTETLESKQNEALKVMPNIFSSNDYEVTVCDPPYAGYTFRPDLSIYDDLPEVKTYITQEKFDDTKGIEYEIENRKRNFFCFGLMKSMPLILQELLYDDGRYNQADITEAALYSAQIVESNTVSKGIYRYFMDSYNVLLNMAEMTDVIEDEKNTFLMMSNNTTHEPMLLQEPEYEPKLYVDNAEYYVDNAERFVVDGREMKMESINQIIHYQANMATFIQLGKWFDYLRENGVYDNTRIILVADHGRALEQFDELILGDNAWEDLECYYPLLMVKDFNSKEYQESKEFMTNADVPTLAMENLIENPINPYTGKKIDSSAKTEENQYITTSIEWDVLSNNGNTFFPSQWYVFDGGNIWDENSWKLLDKKTVLPEE